MSAPAWTPPAEAPDSGPTEKALSSTSDLNVASQRGFERAYSAESTLAELIANLRKLCDETELYLPDLSGRRTEPEPDVVLAADVRDHLDRAERAWS